MEDEKIDELDLTEEDLDIVKETDDELEETGEEDEEKSVNPADSGPSPKDLVAKLAELEASNRGLVKSLAATRNIKQDLQGQLDGIKQALDERRNAEVRDDIEGNSAIPIDFDEEGNPYLDPTKLAGLQNAEIAALKRTVLDLQNNIVKTTIKSTEEQQLNRLLNEKDGYVEAHKSVTKAWNFVKDDLFDDYLVKAGLPTPKTADQAIEIAIGSAEIKEQFTKKFPGLDLESVLEAHLIATPRYLRKALDKALATPGNSNALLDLSRPTSLSNANSSGGVSQAGLLERVANMSNDDFMSLDAATMRKIDKLLEKHG